ncbi:hypothetical protein Glove_41g70 [Diversispora epigaea]|uniref:Uncharacterized protein n=1 Tax=Diversispora epigaea TaxID=1348612 RepID=A0A397JP62_9GLOM|nr:hypothetical protein Glove_41g70 [Diversispora epigaea]
MNSHLSLRRKFLPTKVFYKSKSGLKFRQDKLKDPNKLPDNASSFKQIHREALNLYYNNAHSANEILDPLPDNYKINNNLLIGNFTRDNLLLAESENPILKKLNSRTERNLAKYLNKLEFNEEPFLMSLQPDFSFTVSEKDISAKVKFSIVKENVILCIDGDKHVHSLRPKTEHGKSQISAEILACAFTNFYNIRSSRFKMDQTIHAMRVVGTRFTFYKAFLSRDYFESLKHGFPPENLTATIFRFPPSDNITFYGYDYVDKDHSRLILDLLFRLKEYMLKA